MHQDVKECADKGDIKGLRYIFADCLDVDPTFEKYEQDYEYCKNIPGLFEPHKELEPLKQDENSWNEAYWIKLKTDFMKNFSLVRFQHMRQAAQVVYKDKIIRIANERKRAEQAVKDRVSVVQPAGAGIGPDIDASYAVSLSREQQEQELNIKRKKLEEDNRKIEQAQKKQKETQAAIFAENGQRSRQITEGTCLKKTSGAVLAVMLLAAVICMLVTFMN